MPNTQLINIEKVLEALDGLKDRKVGASYRELSELTDLGVGRVHEIVKKLTDEGYVEHTEGIARSIFIKRKEA